MMRICGIDPGLKGAIAFADVSIDGTVSNACVFDMPVTDQVDGKPLPDAMAIRRIILDQNPDCVVLEHAQFRNQGHQWRTALGFGELRAAVRSCFADQRTHLVYPSVWKIKMGLSSEKDSSLDAARTDFPQLSSFLKRKKDDGRAESLELIIYYVRFLLPRAENGIEVC